MQVAFRPVASDEDVQVLAELAHQIWNEYWPPLIGQAQTNYMVEQFQSLDAIKRDMAEHAYEYWLMEAAPDAPGEADTPAEAAPSTQARTAPETSVEPASATLAKAAPATSNQTAPAAQPEDTAPPHTAPCIVGYTGGHVEPETNRFFISKIYLLARERGKHFGSAAIRFYEDLCQKRGLDAMYLTVNKGNDLAIRAYKGTGFETIDAVETDIGQGFIMDDYIMEKRV